MARITKKEKSGGLYQAIPVGYSQLTLPPPP